MVFNGLGSAPWKKSLALEFVEISNVTGAKNMNRELQKNYSGCAKCWSSHACGRWAYLVRVEMVHSVRVASVASKGTVGWKGDQAMLMEMVLCLTLPLAFTMS